MKQVVQHPIVGDITINLRKGLRSVTYRVSSKGVSISTPPELAHKIFPLSSQRIEWIDQARKEIDARTLHLIISPNKLLQTLTFKVQLTPFAHNKSKFTYRFQDGILAIGFNESIDIEADEHQLVVHRLVKYHLKSEAERYLPQRVAELAQKYGYRFKEVKINSARSRWGSCNSKGIINLSCYLMMLPSELVDYVIVHELCHTVEMNHGEGFKQLMRTHFPRFGELDKQLKIHGRKSAAMKA